MASFASIRSSVYDREERKQQYQAHIRGLNAYDRHNKFLKDYVAFYGTEGAKYDKPPVRTDQDILRQGYRFIRTEEDDMDTSWEQRLVKRYYDKLFKEYCIADMSRYKSGKVNFSYLEAGESKQALVKLVTCPACSEKLHYKKQKEKAEAEKREKDVFHKRKRNAVDHADHSDEDATDKVERKKGKALSSSVHKNKYKDDGDDNLDSFFEGMFP